MTPKLRVAALLLGATVLTLANVVPGAGDFPKPTKFSPGEPHRRHLRDMPDAEIKKYMKGVADGLGVKCSFCHEGKDYASEAIPIKDFARKKIGMVRWLNEKYRPEGAKWEYSCFSCHRGQVRPVPSIPPAPDLKKF